MKYGILSVLLCLILASCGPSLPYRNDSPMTAELFQSRNAEFSGKVPEGWFVAPLDSLPSMYKVWLISDGYRATMNIVELQLDKLSRKEVHDKGLSLLAEISLGFHRASAPSCRLIAVPKEFKLLGREYCGYEIQDDQGRKRVIVFSARGRFYECVMAPNAGEFPPKDVTPLFNTQQTVLSTLLFQ